MKKWLIRLFAVSLIAAALVYWHRVSVINGQLESLAAELTEYGQLSWESLIFDPRGRALVGNLSFRPHREPAAIRVESMILRSTDLQRFTPLLADPDAPGATRSWSIDLIGLRLPIGQQVSDWPLEKLGLLLPFRSRACPGLERPTLGDLIQLGYGQLEMDIILAGLFIDDHLQIDVNAEIKELSNARQRWELAWSEPKTQMDDLKALLAEGSLRELDYQIQDRGLLQRLDAACASGAEAAGDGLDNTQFRAWMRAWSDLGLEPNGIAQAAFRYHLEAPSSPVLISARPDQALPMSDLRSSTDADLLQALNLGFAIADGPRVSLNLKKVPTTRAAAVPVPVAEETTGILRSENDEESIIAVGRPPGWEQIPLDAISDHIGYRVRIELIDGTRIAGRIAGIDGEQMALLSQSRMGEFVRPLPILDIAAIEVRP